jgi:hypothetical protein
LDRPEENAARRRLLATYRGYGRNEALFAGLPDDISWSRVALTPAELADVRYIDWDYWLEVSGGTRRPRDAIARMRADWDAEGSDYRRIAVAAARGPFPRSSWFSDGRQGRIWCCWKATSD